MPDNVGDGDGIGNCREYDAYVAKKPGKEALNKALVALGNNRGCDVFWGGEGTRFCSKFKPEQTILSN